MSRTVYINENGRVACPTHGGHYLAGAVAADPRATEITTPLDAWIAVPADLAKCEDCR